MAQIVIPNATVNRALPSVCICCGQATELRHHFRFIWMPYYVVGFEIFSLVFGLIGNLRGMLVVSMDVPVCQFHRRQMIGSRRLSVLGVWIVVVGVVGFVLIFALFALGAVLGNGFDKPILAKICWGMALAIMFGIAAFGGIGVAVWAIFGLLSQGQPIPRIESKSAGEFVLGKVSPIFASEYNATFEKPPIQR